MTTDSRSLSRGTFHFRSSGIVICGWVLLLVVACSAEVSGPEPSVSAADSKNPPISPAIVCNDQLTTSITLTGDAFSPIPIDIPGDPKVALPSITLLKGSELNGDKVAESEQVFFTGDPSDDETNYLSGDGETPRLMWQSQTEMSLVVDQKLTLSDGKSGILAEGIYDLNIANPDGHDSSSSGALAVVTKPALQEATPEIVCLEEEDRTITLTGQRLLRIGDLKVELQVETAQSVPMQLEGCTEIKHDGLDAEFCESATATLARESIEPGYPSLTLLNPETAACHSVDEIRLRVVPAPTVTAIVPVLGCVAQGARQFEIQGAGFLKIDETVPAVTIGGKDFEPDSLGGCESLETMGRTVETCTSIMVTVAQDALEAGLHNVVVANPEPAGCSATALGAMRITPPPSVTAVEPVLACIEEGDRQFVVQGADFLDVNGVLPAVQIGDFSVAPELISASDCTDLATPGAVVRSCSELTLTVPQDALEAGLYDVTATNPDPAGCFATAAEALRIVPSPTVTAVEPVLVCVDQSERTISIQGSDFLEIDGVVPEVIVGSETIDLDRIETRECETLETASQNVETCSELLVTLDEDSLDNGLYDLTVVNPDPAGCSDTGSELFRVVSGPDVTAVDPVLVCTDDGSRQIEITGTGFLTIDGDVPVVSFDDEEATVDSVDDCSEINVGELEVERCATMTVTVSEDALSAGRPVVTVENPDPAGCSVSADDLLTVPPSVSITSVTPSNICSGADDTEITIEGTGFLRVDDEVFELRIGGEEVTPNAVSGCTDLDVEDMEVESCTTITATVSSTDYSVGDVEISIANPEPSGCGYTADSVFRIVGPPEVTGISPTPICSDVLTEITITGTGFAPGAVVLAGENEADSVQVDSETSLVATFTEGLSADTYAITVENGEGCSYSLPAALEVDPTPIVFFVDPPVIYNGITIEATVFTTGLATAAASVELSDGTNDPLELEFSSPDRANRIQATIPATDTENPLPAGDYEVLVTSDVGCVGALPGGVAITDSLDMGDLSIEPAFASSTKPTAVTINVDTDSGVGFVSTPRVYLNPSTPGAAAMAVRAVVIVDDTTLTGVIPEGLDPGSYDLIVVNPLDEEGSTEVGLAQDALTITSNEPPVITSVLPESFIHNEVVPVTIRGENFDDVGGVSVQLLCNGLVSTVEGTDENAVDAQTVTVSFDIGESGLESGDVCQVELTNSDGAVFAYSAISIRNNSENLNPWSVSSELVEARRAPSVLAARPTTTSRYLYAIGGDTGVTDDEQAIGTVRQTVEAAGIDVYGDMNDWSLQRNSLPEARTWAGVARVGNFIYLTGGHNGTTATNTLYRAQVLDPLIGPEILDLDAALGDETTGLGGGLWIYRIAATYRDDDPNNPGGESIPGEVLNVQLPDRTEGIRINLLWTEVDGANGYRIYRSPAANDGIDALELLDEIDCGATTLCDCSANPEQCQYWDDGTDTDSAYTPLPPGSLGVWHALTGSTLNTPREAHATVAAPDFDTAGQWFLYAFGGRDQNGDYLDTYEYATVTVAGDGTQTVSTWTLVDAAGEKLSTPRAELGAFLVTQEDGEIVGPTEAWIYIGAGRTTVDMSRVIDASLVGPSGDLGTLTQLTPVDQPPFHAGYGYGAANNKLFMFGGSLGAPSSGGISAELCDTASCLPDLQPGAWNALGPGNNTSTQIYSGSAQESAFFFLVGGHDGTNALNTTEQTVQ